MPLAEVLDGVPYRNLLIMQRDKLHTVYGTVIRKCSGREMAARRGRTPASPPTPADNTKC